MSTAKAICDSRTRTPKRTWSRRSIACGRCSRRSRGKSITSVAGVVADALARSGTPRIFGVVSGADAPLLIAARERELPIVLAHTVASAATMAAVTTDLTHAPCVVALDGPVLPDALTAIARCRIDRSSVIFVSSPLRSDATDRAELDVVTKAVISLEPASAAHWIAHAIHLARGAPPGPVCLELDPGVASEPAVPIATSLRAALLPPPDASALDEAARILAAASRPVTLVGAHTRTEDIAGWVRAFAESTPTPVLCSPRAKGVLPDPHPLALGTFSDNPIADTVLARADLVVTAGLDPSEAAARAWNPKTAVLHLGSCPAADAPYRSRLEIVGDIGLVFEELAPRLRDRSRSDWDVAELDRWKRARLAPAPPADDARAFERVVTMAREATPSGTIATVDGPLLRACVRAWQAVAPNEFLTSNDASVTGFAIPAAVAALLVRGNRRAMCFTDAIGFAASVRDLETAVSLGLQVIVIVSAENDRDIEQHARAVGAIGLVARGEAAFGWAMERALLSSRPVVIAVPADG